MRLPDLRRILLSLIGPQPDHAGLASLSDGDWQQIDAMAAQHRIQPHLHARLERGELEAGIAGPVRERWREAHKASAFRALRLRRDALELDRTLRGADIEPVFLKGFLAWHGYPSAAERPMRDIDVLLPRK